MFPSKLPGESSSLVPLHSYQSLAGRKFLFCSLSLTDRIPVEESDDVVLLIVPDFQMLSKVQKVAEDLSGEAGEVQI